MFSYFGSKSKIIKTYPTPKFDTIIEPFAGSAQYACLYGLDKPVWINDKYTVIYNIWKWLQNATIKDIDNLPELKLCERVSDITYLSQVEKDLLGFSIGISSNAPRDKCTWMAANNNSVLQFKKRVKRIIGKIDHWLITNLDYTECIIPEYNCTYFLDPPYQYRNSDYVISNNTNFYIELAAHITNLKGHILTCESIKANWLHDFKLHEIMYTTSGCHCEMLSNRMNKIES